MLHKINATGYDEPLFVWQTADGDTLLLGTFGECADIALAITGMINGVPVPEMSEYDPAITPTWTVGEAAAEAASLGYTADPFAIRAAARRGSIRGATQADGRWLLPRRTFRHWLERHTAETRGRPARR